MSRQALFGKSLYWVVVGSILGLSGSSSAVTNVNRPIGYEVITASSPLICHVSVDQVSHRIDKRIFGTNLEWFNNAGGLGSTGRRYTHLVDLARKQGITNYRFPGGILADYYDWKDGIGSHKNRKTTKHPSDSGKSRHTFGSVEYFRFLTETDGQALITVNAGTGSAAEAAAWVSYANDPNNELRIKDGITKPVGVKMWEVGNELYLPGNPTEMPVSVSPEVYAGRFIEFADAMRAVDPTIEVIAIGEVKPHEGPGSAYPDWTEEVLSIAADKIDHFAVHNAYFPMLVKVRQPEVSDVYSNLFASPEAVERSLFELEALLDKYSPEREIGIAITEWGALFSLPRVDPYWFDHVKTLGTAVYISRLMQVFMSNSRVKIANYFKLVDRSFMGWIDYKGQPKVPYWAFAMYARLSGTLLVDSSVNSPVYDTPGLGIIAAESDVAEVTSLATLDEESCHLFVNFVNRSLDTEHNVSLKLADYSPKKQGLRYVLTGSEPTAHNGRDVPSEWPYKKMVEPYSSETNKPISIEKEVWDVTDVLTVPPFSIVTVELSPDLESEMICKTNTALSE